MCRLKRGQGHLDHKASAWAHGGLLDLQIPLHIGVRSTRKHVTSTFGLYLEVGPLEVIKFR